MQKRDSEPSLKEKWVYSHLPVHCAQCQGSKEFWTEQVPQALFSSFTITFYCQRIKHSNHESRHEFGNKKLPLNNKNRVIYIQKAFETILLRSFLAKVLTQPTPIRMQMFFTRSCLWSVAFQRSLSFLWINKYPSCPLVLLSSMCWCPAPP